MSNDLLERDIETVCAAMKDLTKRYSCNMGEEVPKISAELGPIWTSLVGTMNTLLRKNGVNVTKKGSYFPKNTPKVLDGQMFFGKSASYMCYCIAAIVGCKWHVAFILCQKLVSTRGLCWVCMPYVTNKALGRNPTVGFQGDVLLIVKEHAVHRAMERSPFKDYDRALGMILWTALVAEYHEENGEDINPPLLNLFTYMANCCYKRFGRLVGTSLYLKDLPPELSESENKRVVLINTYMTD